MTTEMTRTGSQALAAPTFMKPSDAGKANITSNDIRFPALKLAQSMTPQAKRSDPAYIDGLREGDLFNTVSKEIYGDKTIQFLVINYLGRRNMEFDKDNRKVVIEANFPDSDPRCQFTIGPDPENPGKTKKFKPVATSFKDFVILLLHDGAEPEILTLSVKGTQLKKVVDLVTAINNSKYPAYAHLVEATPVPETFPKGQCYGWRFDLKGWAPEAAFMLADAAYKKAEGKNIEIDRDDNPESEIDAADPVASNVSDEDVSDEDIPF